MEEVPKEEQIDARGVSNENFLCKQNNSPNRGSPNTCDAHHRYPTSLRLFMRA